MEFTEKLYNISDQKTSGWERRELFLDFVLCSVPGLQCNKAVQTSFAKAPASKYRNFSIAGIGLEPGAASCLIQPIHQIPRFLGIVIDAESRFRKLKIVR